MIRHEVDPYLQKTGLYDLLPLTDEEDLCRCQPPIHRKSRSHSADGYTSSSSSSDDEWPEPVRRRIYTGTSKLIRENKRLERIYNSNKRHRIHQTRWWELEDGRRCRTAFKGRPDLVLKQRPNIPKAAPPAVWLSRLQKEGYELEEVKWVSVSMKDRCY